MTDLVRLITDTQRELEHRPTSDGRDARVLIIRRHYDAPIEAVWQACTEPDRINRWLRPISGDLRPGGKFQLEDNAGGDILHCEPPHRLVLTWVYGPMANEGESSVVEFRFAAAAGGGTDFVLDHAAVLDLPEDQWLGGVGYFGAGWETATTYLDKYLHGELPDAPVTEWFDPESPENAARDARVFEAWSEVAAALASRTGASPSPA